MLAALGLDNQAQGLQPGLGLGIAKAKHARNTNQGRSREEDHLDGRTASHQGIRHGALAADLPCLGIALGLYDQANGAEQLLDPG